MDKHGVEFDVDFSFGGSLCLSASGFGFSATNLWSLHYWFKGLSAILRSIRIIMSFSRPFVGWFA